MNIELGRCAVHGNDPHRQYATCKDWERVIVEDISSEELEAAASVYDSLADGSFYERQNAACVELFGHPARTIPERTTPLEPFLERFYAALKDHDSEKCPSCRAFERDREERGMNQ